MDLILLILAIVYAVKRGTIAGLEAPESPDVPDDEFEEWKRLELRSRDVVMWTGFGWLGIEILGAIAMGGYVVPLAMLGIPTLLCALIVAGVYGHKANKIRKRYQFDLRSLRKARPVCHPPSPAENTLSSSKGVRLG